MSGYKDISNTKLAQCCVSGIVFVPECLVPSYGECGWRELFEFTTRQITITRVYYPRLWRIGFVAQLIFTAAFLSLPFTQPVLWLLLYGLSSAKAWVRLRAVRSVLPAAGLLRFGWFYILFSPLVALLYLYNMVRSAVSADIVWREKRYRLISPSQTCVL